MKPNFALTLSPHSISLLYRAASGWTRVGEVHPGRDDLDDALGALREQGDHLDVDHACKLIIPADQIKYLSIEAEGDPDAAVRAALEGATPYAVGELEYDWTAEAGRIQIAAVALDTLTEAEAFAVEHDFDPVCFSAIPDPADFRGEPFFGMTRRAARSLPEGTVVERDDAAIHVTGPAQMPADAAAGEIGDDTADGDDTPVASAATRAVAEAPPAPRRTPPPDQPSAADTAPKGQAAPQPPKPADPNPAPAIASFTSIRASRSDDMTGAIPPLAGQPRLSRLDGADIAKPAQPAPQPPLPGPAGDDVTDPARMAELAASLQPALHERGDHATPDATRQQLPSPPPGCGPIQRSETIADDWASAAKAREAKAREAAQSRRAREAERMTVFGARNNEVRGKPRFLGLIMTAVLLLFLVGVAAWASLFLDDGLASIFARDNVEIADMPVAGDDDPATSEATDSDAPATVVALPGTPESDSQITALPDDSRAADVATLPELPAPLSPSEAKARYAATGIWQMAPTAPDIPAAGAPLDDLYEVSVDPAPTMAEPAEMPRRAPDARDVAIKTPAVPPAAGMRFDFDERGFVRATPDGVLTPEGVLVYAGRPALTPPQSMVQAITVTATPDGDGAATVPFAGDPALADTPPRPRPTDLVPTGADPAVPGDDQGGDNRATGAVSDTRIANDATDAVFRGDPSLAALRPRARARPTPATSPAAATLQSAEGAATQPLVEDAALTRALSVANASDPESEPEPEPDVSADAFQNATAQAVTASLMPLRRPGDFASIVQQSRSQAAQQAVPVDQQYQPTLPTKASVAKQATDKNAINLRKVNLIGVYGGTSNRRALVRLDNGRYQKVRVGDRLDGGRVAAIGDSQLRYIKKGRNVVLQIPEG